ncbi:hypothetical protein [Acetobacter phage phiAX1]|nr:hypothetical protein [Acetobacter phage phiAX1]
MNVPANWITIAVYSPNENRFVPAPGAKITESQAMARANVQHRTVTVSGKKLLQVKAK